MSLLFLLRKLLRGFSSAEIIVKALPLLLRGFSSASAEMSVTLNPEAREKMRAACRAAGGPGTKEGWAVLWEQEMTLWDLKGATKVLSAEFTKGVVAGRLSLSGACLVPGCGSAYDVKALAHAGVRRVVGIDIVPLAVERAAGIVGEGLPNVELLTGDFFADERLVPASFAWAFDYTFFCALPPSLRAAWGKRTAELLEPGGRLLTLAFPMGSDDVASDPLTPGPPHTVSLSEYAKALNPHGVTVEEGPFTSPLSMRGNEQVIWWRKEKL